MEMQTRSSKPAVDSHATQTSPDPVIATSQEAECLTLAEKTPDDGRLATTSEHERILQDCQRSLERVVHGDVMEIVMFTPVLYRYMTYALPVDPTSLTRELGQRAATILSATKSLCDEQDREHKELAPSRPSALSHSVMAVLGYILHFNDARLPSAICILKFMLTTDQLYMHAATFQSHKQLIYGLCFLANIHHSLLYNLAQFIACVCLWEVKNIM